MARKTRKHLLNTLFWETADLSWDAMIYSSGGVTHTVYIEALNDEGKTPERYDRTFTGDNSRVRAYGWARKQERLTTDPDSKYMATEHKAPV